MNIRKALMISFISFAFLVTGCSSKGIDSVQQIADEATCQKTMTKVQNNVNEIIGKDYKYVLENMGRPYCTTYYIDMDKVKDISNIEELNNIENIRLIYPKETNVDKSKSSALYIQLDNNIVKDVQTYELLSKDEKENIKEIIIAVSPTLEGETTSLYISKLLEPFKITVSKIAYGIPIGADMEYLDPMTLSMAMSNRNKIS